MRCLCVGGGGGGKDGGREDRRTKQAKEQHFMARCSFRLKLSCFPSTSVDSFLSLLPQRDVLFRLRCRFLPCLLFRLHDQQNCQALAIPTSFRHSSTTLPIKKEGLGALSLSGPRATRLVPWLPAAAAAEIIEQGFAVFRVHQLIQGLPYALIPLIRMVSHPVLGSIFELAPRSEMVVHQVLEILLVLEI